MSLMQSKLLGKVRVEVARTLDSNGFGVYNRELDPCFIWVIDFPLFLPSDTDSSQLESCHHPFTAPRESDREILMLDPVKCLGEHFDLVLNGEEVGGGSVRIHDALLQKHVLQNILGIQDIEDKMGYFLEALESGCPPHGGIALGLDRLVTFMCPSAISIRDVIAFPKSNGCHDLMTGAPSEIDAQTKALYHIQAKTDFSTRGASSCCCQNDQVFTSNATPIPPPAPPVTACRSFSSSSSTPTLPSPPSSLAKEPGAGIQTEVKKRDDDDDN